jgi:predicted ATPase
MIKSITLGNFKCFENQILECAPLTLLTGLNGMGKSSAMQSLLLLRQSHHQGLLREKGLALNGDLVCVGKGTDALFEDAKEDYIRFELTFDGHRSAFWRFAYNRTSDVIGREDSNATDETYDTNLFGDAFHYLQAERRGPRTAFEISEYLVRQHRQLGVHGEYAAHFLAAFGREEVTNEAVLHSDATSRRLSDQVEAWLGEIAPGTRIRLNEHGNMDLVSVDYAFVARHEVSGYYRSTNVGFGITYTLPVLTALLASPSGSLVLLENPEAHVHPRGQARLGELIARAVHGGVQVMVETHSDHVLNGTRIAIRRGLITPDDVVIQFFGRTPSSGGIVSHIQTMRVDANGRIANWPDGFFDEWDNALEALLEPPGK